MGKDEKAGGKESGVKRKSKAKENAKKQGAKGVAMKNNPGIQINVSLDEPFQLPQAPQKTAAEIAAD